VGGNVKNEKRWRRLRSKFSWKGCATCRWQKFLCHGYSSQTAFWLMHFHAQHFAWALNFMTFMTARLQHTIRSRLTDRGANYCMEWRQCYPVYRVAQRSKPLPNDKTIVLDGITAYQW